MNEYATRSGNRPITVVKDRRDDVEKVSSYGSKLNQEIDKIRRHLITESLLNSRKTE